jgi:hypothetical protein
MNKVLLFNLKHRDLLDLTGLNQESFELIIEDYWLLEETTGGELIKYNNQTKELHDWYIEIVERQVDEYINA